MYTNDVYSNPASFMNDEEKETLNEFMCAYLKHGPEVFSTSDIRRELEECWPDASVAVHNYVRFKISAYKQVGYLKQIPIPPTLNRKTAKRYSYKGPPAFCVSLTAKGKDKFNRL